MPKIATKGCSMSYILETVDILAHYKDFDASVPGWYQNSESKMLPVFLKRCWHGGRKSSRPDVLQCYNVAVCW